MARRLISQCRAIGQVRDLTAGFLPVNRTVSSNGFTAEWSVPFIARGVRAEGQGDTITGLDATALGVSFIEVADPYQSVNRSLKYALLFLGLLFLSYFVFEVTTGKRVHPAQYVLVGSRRSSSTCFCCRSPRESASMPAFCSQVRPRWRCFQPMRHGCSPVACRE